MFCVIWRFDGVVGGFIEDELELPVAYETEEEAEEAMKGHIMESCSEVIEI